MATDQQSPTGRTADNIVGFARALRAAGIPVGPGAVIDAMNAIAAELRSLGVVDAVVEGSGRGIVGAWRATPLEPLRFGVHLRAEEEGGARQPQPEERDDDRREAAPRLVVRAEVRRVDAQAA